MSDLSPPANPDWEDLQPPPEGESLLGDYRVELPVFEGPLDLLLHLIRKHEIDIFDIPVALITDKYLQYLEWMRVLNLDIAGEFLVMAASLAYIKSRMLLPPDQLAAEEEEGEEVDPREELVRRLLEYQKYKEAADELRDRPVLYRDVFVRGEKAPPAESDSPFSEVSVFRLIEALDRVMKRASKKFTHQVMIDRVSIADRIQELCDRMTGREDWTFDELFEDVRSRMMVVTTLLALLEMARLQLIRLLQVEDSEIIHVHSLLEGRAVDQVLANVKLEV